MLVLKLLSLGVRDGHEDAISSRQPVVGRSDRDRLFLSCVNLFSRCKLPHHTKHGCFDGSRTYHIYTHSAILELRCPRPHEGSKRCLSFFVACSICHVS